MFGAKKERIMKKVLLWVNFFCYRGLGDRFEDIVSRCFQVSVSPDETWGGIESRCLEVLLGVYPPEQGWRGHEVRPLERPLAVTELPDHLPPTRRRILA